jgi:hypothetical protein
MKEQTPSKGYGKYGKRPIWQWILLYLIIGSIIYFIVYLLFFKDSGGGGLY